VIVKRLPPPDELGRRVPPEVDEAMGVFVAVVMEPVVVPRVELWVEIVG